MSKAQHELFSSTNAMPKATVEGISAMQLELKERLNHQKEYTQYYFLAGIGRDGEHSDLWATLVADDRSGNQALRKRIKEAKASRKRPATIIAQ